MKFVPCRVVHTCRTGTYFRAKLIFKNLGRSQFFTVNYYFFVASHKKRSYNWITKLVSSCRNWKKQFKILCGPPKSARCSSQHVILDVFFGLVCNMALNLARVFWGIFWKLILDFWIFRRIVFGVLGILDRFLLHFWNEFWTNRGHPFWMIFDNIWKYFVDHFRPC